MKNRLILPKLGGHYTTHRIDIKNCLIVDIRGFYELAREEGGGAICIYLYIIKGDGCFFLLLSLYRCVIMLFVLDKLSFPIYYLHFFSSSQFHNNIR